MKSIPKVTVYVKPGGQEEEFRYVDGFEKGGNVYLKLVDLGGILQHELVHVFEYRAIEEKYGYSPGWFQEGIAQYYSGGQSELGSEAIRNFIVVENARFLSERVESRQIHKRSELNPAVYFNLTAYEEHKKGKEQAIQFHALALQPIEHLVETKGGEEKLKELLLTMKKGHSFDASFDIVYEMTPYDLWNSWNNHE
jgi:hypothetical protein